MFQISSLNKAFGEVVVAKDFYLNVPEGQLLGVLGPNGAGKSSLFNLVSGLIKPDAGQIVLDGRSLLGMSVSARARFGVGRSFQIPRPFGEMSVYENLLAAAAFGGGCSETEAASLCGGILARTGLDASANQRAGSLPLLERKRLEMARALATKPKLLLLDEIAGGLTEAECTSLIETIADIKSTGVTIIWIEHVVNALLAVADRLIVVNAGDIIADGGPDDVMNNPDVQSVYMGMSL